MQSLVEATFKHPPPALSSTLAVQSDGAREAPDASPILHEVPRKASHARIPRQASHCEGQDTGPTLFHRLNSAAGGAPHPPGPVRVVLVGQGLRCPVWASGPDGHRGSRNCGKCTAPRGALSGGSLPGTVNFSVHCKAEKYRVTFHTLVSAISRARTRLHLHIAAGVGLSCSLKNIAALATIDNAQTRKLPCHDRWWRLLRNPFLIVGPRSTDFHTSSFQAPLVGAFLFPNSKCKTNSKSLFMKIRKASLSAP